jgi:4-amino-4-deoxy-L-arabinose transferase-like glycosyltransferase
MLKFDITEFNIYRWRYWLGYGIVTIGLISVLIFAGLYLPGGISNYEMQSIVTSNNISFVNLDSIAIIDLPYHLLQQAGLMIFGMSIISIKLPSILLALLSAIAMILLLKRWFHPNIGILASLIAITTGQFLFIAQDGTPGVLYLFWSVWLLLLASLISSSQKYRRHLVVAFCIMATLSLYTPLSVYVIIALVSATILHPHLRFLIKQIPRTEVYFGLAAILLSITPLIVAIFKQPSLALTLLGIPTDRPNFGENISSLAAQYLGFSHPGGTTIMTPFFELGSMLIIVVGIYHVIRTKETAKSYIISLWLLCLAPIIMLNPKFTSIAFLPLVLLLASGLSTLLLYWYRLFPRNPYARIAGLIPIVILVSALVFSGINRYVYGYLYDPSIVSNFSKDIKLIPASAHNIVVTDSELAFYQVIAKYNKNLTVSTTVPSSDTFLATRAAKKDFSGYIIKKIITTSSSKQGDRFYLYEKSI